MWTVVAAAVTVAVLAAVGQGAIVDYIKPTCGSLAGETRMTIYGSNFSGDQFSQNNDPTKGNKVYLKSATGMEYPCRIHKDGCTKSQIQCYTPARMREELYYLKISVDGIKAEQKDICGGNPWSSKCTYKPQSNCTPTVDIFSPSSGNPGTFVSMIGQIYSDRRGSNNATARNGKTEKITRVYVGPRECQLKFPGNDTFYGLSLDNETSNHGTIKCKTQGSSTGFFNASFIVEAPYGRSLSSAHHVSYNDIIYMIQFYLNISKLSANTGSTEGGLNLTIDVDNIDDRLPYEKLKIYIGDEECIQKDISINESVTCEVPADPKYSASSFPGNRGIDFMYWTSTTKDLNSLNDVGTLTSASPGYHKTTMDDTFFYDVMMENYVSKMTGFFSPPHNGVYEFYLRADDGGRLFINGEETVTSKNYVWAVSKRVTLDNTKRYLLEIIHYQTTGNASVHLKTKFLNTSFTSSWTETAVVEIQNITVLSPALPDIQILKFTDFDSQTAQDEVQTVKFNKEENEEFRFCLYQVCTELLTTQTSDTVMGDAIKSLPIFSTEETVNVNRQETEEPTFTITIGSKRGNFPLLSVKTKEENSPLTYIVTENTAGVPDNDLVTLSLNGTVSNPVSVADLTLDKVEGFVNSLFEAKCPEVFSSPSYKIHYENYEENSEKFSGTRVKDTEPFCGRYALKSPGYIYRRGHNEAGIMLSSHGTLCFAYKGYLVNYVRATFSYKPSLNSEAVTLTSDIPFKTDSSTGLETWSYVCLNVFYTLSKTHPGGTDYRLLQVGVSNQSADKDGYIDSVFIGQKNTTNDPDVNLRRLPPARPNNALIDEVKVRSISNTEYEVTLKPFECGSQFPLIILANGKTSGSELYPSSSVAYQLDNGQGTLSVRRTSAASPPPSGFVDITFDKETKTNLNISLEPNLLKAELESLNSTGEVSVRQDGDCANYNYTITFQTRPGDLEDMTVSNLQDESGGTEVNVANVVDGGLFYNPISGDMLRTVHTTPQVFVLVNGVPTACSGDCSFQWLSSVTPTVESAQPASGTLALGTSLMISGTGFNTDKTKNIVTIGGVECIVTVATETSITCDVGNCPVGEHTIVVNVDGKGNSKGDVKFECVAKITGVSPESGSCGGGNILTITGYGFSADATVAINSGICDVRSVQPDQITCTVPAMTQEGTYSVEIRQGEGDTGSAPTISFTGYSCSSSLTATITTVTPATLPCFGGEVTVTGSSFTEQAGSVSVGAVKGRIVSWTDTKIVANFTRVPPGTHNLLINATHGYATYASLNIPTILGDLHITNVHPLRGSVLGGTNLTISGSTFGTDSELVRVKVDDVNCENPVVTNNRIVCKIGDAAKTHSVYNNRTSLVTGSPYGYNPPHVNLMIGDSLRISWNSPDKVISVTEVESPSNTTPKTEGFTGPSGTMGNFMKKFTVPGRFYAWSGNATNDILTIDVSATGSKVAEISVNVGGFEAIHDVGGASDPSDTSACKSITSGKQSCQDSMPTGGNSGKFNFAFWTCSTPIIKAVNVNNGTVETEITINGEGFSLTKCQNEVKFGGHRCDVTSSSETVLTCKLAKSGQPDIGVLLPLSVNVVNRGYALVEVMSDEKSSFSLIPSIDRIEPTSGSLAGGTHVTITGFGFWNSPLVSIGNSPCDIIESSDTKIICKSPISAQGRQGEREVVVTTYVGEVPLNARCETETKNCKFLYASLWTPTVTIITPDSMSGSETFTVSGTNLGTDASDLEVVSGEVYAVVAEVSGTFLKATFDSLPVGDNEVVVRRKGYGRASGTLSVTSNLNIAQITPSSGSVNGGTVVTLGGNGFIVNETDVTLGDTSCEIIATTLSTVTCKTAAHAAATVQVVVNSNGKSATSSYTFSSAATPVINSVSPESGFSGDTLTITGSNLDGSAVSVTLDDADCQVSAKSNTEIKCVLGHHSSGPVAVLVNVEGSGHSNIDKHFEYLLLLSNISPSAGGTAGGQTVTVTGAGFEDSAIVTICGQTCSKVETTSSEYTCNTPANTDVEKIVEAEEILHDEPGKESRWAAILGTHVLRRLAVSHEMIIDISYPERHTRCPCGCKTSISIGDCSFAQTCDVQITLNDVVKTLPSSYTYDDALSPTVTNVTPRRSGTGGGTTITIEGSGFGSVPSNVEVKIDNTECKVSSAVDTEIVCVTEPHPGSVETKVEIQVDKNGISKEGSAGAADFIYIDVWSSLYTWDGGPLPQEGEFIVVPSGMTLLLDTDTPILDFLLIQGGKVIFDEKDIELRSKMILITDGGLLQVGTESEPFQHKGIITLHGHVLDPEMPIYGTKGIGVRNGTLDLHGKEVPLTWTKLAATAEAGSTTLKLQHPVEWNVGDEIAIASTGDRHSQSENEKKTISSVSSDKTTLTLTSPLEHQHLGTSETFNGVTVDFSAEVGLLTHNVVVRGNEDAQWNDKIESCEKGFNTDEFATMTCFQGRFGDDIGSSQLGSHIMVHSPEKDKDLAVARISYTEVTFAGQAFRLGRYPIHFHLLGQVSASYVRGCGIHQTFNRAVNIHGTHNMTVEWTVIYNIMGGSFFLEDGIETGNTFQYNLGVFVKSSTSLLNDDITPAVFWVTNPNNTVQHNAAAGGTHFGFWYRMNEHPDGPSYTPDICVKRVPLGTFRNNSAHSFGWFALWIFPDFYPHENPCEESDAELAVFERLTAFNNDKGAECVNCGFVKFSDCRLIHNRLAGIEYKVGSMDSANSPVIENSLIVGTTSALPDPSSDVVCTKGGVVFGYGTGFRAEKVTFVNFQDPSCVAFRWARIDGTCGHFCGSYTYHMDGTQFINAPNKGHFEWLFEGMLIDSDGTAGGKAGYTILPETGIQPDSCEDAPEYSMGIKASKCPNTWHSVGLNKVLPYSAHGKALNINNEHGTSKCPFGEKRVVFKNGYEFSLPDGTTNVFEWEDLTFGNSNVSFNALFGNFTSGQYLIIALKVPELPDRFSIDGGKTFINHTDGDLDPSAGHTGDWVWDNNNKMIKFLVNDKELSRPGVSTYIYDRRVDLKVFKCEYPNCEPPPDPNTIPPALARPDDFDYYDDETLWNETADGFVSNIRGAYGTPKALDNVWIANGTWVVVNKTTVFNKLRKLLIEGVLEFFDTEGAEYMIEADFIVIRCGRLLIGWPDDPFDGLATIVLRGNLSSPYFSPGEGPNLGSKAIGAFGGLDLFGKDVGRTWTQLAAKAAAGSDEITLAEEVNWSAGDEIVIGPTSFNPWETEVFKIVSVDSNKVKLTLNSTLKYLHTAHKETLSTGQEIDVGAAVGLLTRNIKIIGENYGDLYKESFGARVLVGTVTSNGQTCTGYARVSNVEFYHTGQESFKEEFDPRFSLSYLNTGTVSDVKPSFARRNAFHNGFSTAIGVFGTGSLNVTENVIMGTVGAGLITNSDATRLDGNLVALVVSPSTYQDRYETYNFDSIAGIEAMLASGSASGLVLKNNLVTGSERFAYHVPPQDCDDESDLMNNNKAYGNVVGGPVVTPHDVLSQTDCAKMSGYTVWKTFDYAVYYQNRPSVIFDNILSIDNRNGLFPIVIEPDSVKHLYADKFVQVQGSTFVGQTDSVECDVDVAPENDDNFKLSEKARHTNLPFDGWVGLTVGNFYKKDNGYPSHPMDGCMAYPAIGGRTKLKNLVFAKYWKNSCKSDYAVSTNVNNDDGIHPVEIEGLTFIDSDYSNRLFLHRPNVGKINSADCVDMDCDGHKKNVFKDLDGSLLNHIGHVISQSEFDWDVNPQRGLGDYRIPKQMVTDDDGTRIPYETICPNKGIYRNENCVYQSSWQAYECENDVNYEMLIIESMDEDTETRRLSPVAMLADGYVDLINGPQDHGWCSGYTCRKRLSTFMAVVATDKDYLMHFTSVAPEHLRYRLLNSAADKGIKLTVWYSKPNRLDVFVDDVFVEATNVNVDSNGRHITSVPTGNEYDPKLSDGTGANFHDKESGDHSVIILGPKKIDVKAIKSVIVSFRLPSLTVDEFFGENIVYNLARFLDIPQNKVRVVHVSRAVSSTRRKRSVEESIVDVEIGDEPTTFLNETAPDSMDHSKLLGIAADIVNECQVGSLSESFNITGECETVHVPSTDTGEQSIVYSTPSPHQLFFSEHPEAKYEGSPLHKQPKIRVSDLSDTFITELGITEFPWQITASLRAGTGHPKAMLNGTLTVSASNGWFNFTDLVISHMGSGYVLDFYVSYPEKGQHFSIASSPFDVRGRSVKISVFDQSSGDIVCNSRFFVTLGLQDLNTHEIISDIAWREHTWTAEVRILESSEYGSLDGTLTSSFDIADGRAFFPDLNFTGFGTFYIQFRVVSNPPDYNLTYNHKLTIKRPEHVGMTIEEQSDVEVKFGAVFKDVLPDEDKENGFEQMVLTEFAHLLSDVHIPSGSIREGSIVVTFSIAGTHSSVNATTYSLCDNIYSEKSFTYNGHTLTLEPYLTVNNQTYYGVTCGEMSKDDKDEGIPSYVIIIAILVPSLLIIGLVVVLVWKYMIKPKTKTHVPVFVKPVASNMKFNYTTHGSHYIGYTQRKLEDKEFLFRDHSFTSLGASRIESPISSFPTNTGSSKFLESEAYRGGASPASPTSVKLGQTAGQNSLNAGSWMPAQDAMPRRQSLQVPVSPHTDTPEPRQPSPSGRASPMLHRACTPERENSLPPVGDDKIKERF